MPHPRTAIQLRLLCVDSRVRVEVNDADLRVPILVRGRPMPPAAGVWPWWTPWPPRGVSSRPPKGKSCGLSWALRRHPNPRIASNRRTPGHSRPIPLHSEPSPHPLPPAGVRPPAPGPPGSNPAVAAWATSDSRNDTSTSASPAPKTPCSPPCRDADPDTVILADGFSCRTQIPSSTKATAKPSTSPSSRPRHHPDTHQPSRPGRRPDLRPGDQARPTPKPATAAAVLSRRDRVRRQAGQPGENR